MEIPTKQSAYFFFQAAHPLWGPINGQGLISWCRLAQDGSSAGYAYPLGMHVLGMGWYPG